MSAWDRYNPRDKKEVKLFGQNLSKAIDVFKSLIKKILALFA